MCTAAMDIQISAGHTNKTHWKSLSFSPTIMPPSRTQEPVVPHKRKPGKPITACAECRRSKLRCDGQIPCSTCVTRGCRGLCPDHTMTLRQKNVYILNGTVELHDHIDILVGRIIALENGLAKVQSTHSLLAPDLMKIKSSLVQADRPQPLDSGTSISSVLNKEVENDSYDENDPIVKQEHQLETLLGTLSLNASGESEYLGGSTGADNLKLTDKRSSSDGGYSGLPRELLELCHNEYVRPDEAALLGEIVSRIPPLAEAIKFCDGYINHCRYKPSLLFSRDDLLDEIIQPIYSQPTPDFTILALLFVIMAIGFSYTHTLPMDSVEGQDYYWLALAITKLRPPTQRATLNNIRLLIFMSYYEHVVKPGSKHFAWMVINEAVRIAISAGLHINGEHWKLPPALLNKRHRTFWSLFMTDTFLSLSVGRPPAISLSYVDCPIPTDVSPVQKWIIDYTLVLYSISAATLSTTTPSYKSILALDKRVRDMAIPESSATISTSDDPEIVYQRYMLFLYKELALLLLHKPYVAVALRDSKRLEEHKYMASVTTVCRSASRVIKGQRTYWLYEPTRPIVDRQHLLWSYTLSALVSMCQIATKAPSSELALMASQSLRVGEILMADAAPTCSFAEKHLELVRQMNSKALTAVLASDSDTSPEQASALLDEIDRISGKTHLNVASASPTLRPNKFSSSDLNGTPFSAGMPSSYDWSEPILPGGEMPAFDRRRVDVISQFVQSDAPVEEQYMHPDLVHDMGVFNGVLTGGFSADIDQFQGMFSGHGYAMDSTPSSSSHMWSQVPFGGAWEDEYQFGSVTWPGNQQ